jgi:3-methyladenine DNA glycosylase AlkD
VAGSIVARFPAAKRVLRRWARDGNLWVRRSAMLALAPRSSKKDFELFARFASALIAEREFFIRKAIGWVLRETSKSRPQPVYAFLREHIDAVSGLTLREGSKYLPQSQRAELMKLHQRRAVTPR